MWSRATAAVIALSCAGAAAPVVVTEAAASPVAQAASCVRARIGGHSKCLAVGKPCARRYQRQYENHGFTCFKNSRGRYRLAYEQQQQQQ